MVGAEKRKHEDGENEFSDEDLPELEEDAELPPEDAAVPPPPEICFPRQSRASNDGGEQGGGAAKGKFRKGPNCVRCQSEGWYCGSTPWARCCRKIIEAAKSNATKNGWKDLFDQERTNGGEAFRRLLRDFEAGCPPGPGNRRPAFDHAQYREKYYTKTEVVRGSREELLDYAGWIEFRTKTIAEDKAHLEWCGMEKDPKTAPYDFETSPVLAFWVQTGRAFRDTLHIKGQDTIAHDA